MGQLKTFATIVVSGVCFLAGGIALSRASSFPSQQHVALLDAAFGRSCQNSTWTLGDNLPRSAISDATDIVQIYTIEPNPGASVAGWVYETQNGAVFIQEKAAYSNFWSSLVDAGPALSPLAKRNSGAAEPMTSNSAKALEEHLHAHGGVYARCFLQPLHV